MSDEAEGGKSEERSPVPTASCRTFSSEPAACAASMHMCPHSSHVAAASCKAICSEGRGDAGKPAAGGRLLWGYCGGVVEAIAPASAISAGGCLIVHWVAYTRSQV